jgi:PAP_fibrillin
MELSNTIPDFGTRIRTFFEASNVIESHGVTWIYMDRTWSNMDRTWSYTDRTWRYMELHGQDMRIDFQFDNASFDFKALPFKIPYPVPFRLLGDETKGWIDITYLSRDGNFRLSRGNKVLCPGS